MRESASGDPLTTETTEPSEIRFHLTATVTVTDAAGVSVDTDTFDEAIKIIRARLHSAPPLVALDPASAESQHMSPGRWEIRANEITEAAETDRTPDYSLHYKMFVLTTLPEGTEYTSPQIDDLLQAVAAMAAQAGEQVSVDTDLLGMTSTSFAPPPPKPEHAPTVSIPVIPPKPTEPPTVGTPQPLLVRADKMLRGLTERLRSEH